MSQGFPAVPGAVGQEGTCGLRRWRDVGRVDFAARGDEATEVAREGGAS